MRTVEGLLFEEAVAITGNAKALLQLRAQIDCALGNETSHPFEKGVYQDMNGTPFEVAVKRAKSKGEMGEPVPKPERTAERLPWAEGAREAAEKEVAGGDQEGNDPPVETTAAPRFERARRQEALRGCLRSGSWR